MKKYTYIAGIIILGVITISVFRFFVWQKEALGWARNINSLFSTSGKVVRLGTYTFFIDKAAKDTLYNVTMKNSAYAITLRARRCTYKIYRTKLELTFYDGVSINNAGAAKTNITKFERLAVTIPLVIKS